MDGAGGSVCLFSHGLSGSGSQFSQYTQYTDILFLHG
jgi:hypothetical protein